MLRNRTAIRCVSIGYNVSKHRLSMLNPRPVKSQSTRGFDCLHRGGYCFCGWLYRPRPSSAQPKRVGKKVRPIFPLYDENENAVEECARTKGVGSGMPYLPGFEKMFLKSVG